MFALNNLMSRHIPLHIAVQVPADVLAQVRFLNETNRSARKAKPKQVKKLFAKPKLVKQGDDDSTAFQLVEGSTEQPPVRAVVSLAFADKPDTLEGLKVTDSTTAAQLLAIAKCDPAKCFLAERGGNIGL